MSQRHRGSFQAAEGTQKLLPDAAGGLWHSEDPASAWLPAPWLPQPPGKCSCFFSGAQKKAQS